MEAATLQKKKINKGKLKKTIKNVLCRPDPVFWPTVSAENERILEIALSEHKVQIPEFKKLHWKTLKLFPKEKRPKPPKIKKVDGLLFGISECLEAILSGKCSAIVIEATVNPQTIVQPILEACVNAKVPVVCLNGLRKISASNFGITTSCMGVKLDCFQDICDKILLLAKDKFPQVMIQLSKPEIETSVTDTATHKRDINNEEVPMDTNESPYLFRSNKKSRVFIPPSDREGIQATTQESIGQEFIKVSDKLSKKPYMKMMVKRISNNPNRVKLK